MDRQTGVGHVRSRDLVPQRDEPVALVAFARLHHEKGGIASAPLLDEGVQSSVAADGAHVLHIAAELRASALVSDQRPEIVLGSGGQRQIDGDRIGTLFHGAHHDAGVAPVGKHDRPVGDALGHVA